MERQQNSLAQRFNGRISPPAKLASALKQIECTDTTIAPRRSAYDFPWFDEANRRETMDYLLAKKFAEAQHLYHQIAHYKQQVIKFVTKDMADRVLALVASEFGYSGPRYYHPDGQPVPDKAPFWPVVGVPLWRYQRIEDFERLVPPGALAARALLERAGICPQAYWVSEKYGDLNLSAQFGRWFAAIYAWESYPHSHGYY